MRTTPIQNAFNSGEFSPLTEALVNFEPFKSALRNCLNSVPLIQGPVTRRPGFYFCDASKDSSKTCRAVAFRFSTTQAYVLEFGDQYIRFKRNNAPVTEAALVITGVTKANPGVVTSVAHGLSNGDQVDIVSIVGMTEINNRRFTVAGVTADTFQLGIDTTSYKTYSSGGTASRVYTIASPYLEVDVPNLKFTQSADVLYIFHPSYAPRKLSRTAHTSWTMSVISYRDGPYMPINSGTVTITPSAVIGAGITLTASSATFTVTSDIGRLVRIKHGTTWGYATITATASTTSVTATVVSDFGANTASAAWRLGAWSITTGYPSCGTFFEDRLWAGGNTASPQTLYGSKTADYENHAPTDTSSVVAADNAISATLNSSDVQSIYWMIGDDRALLIGTESGEWVIRGTSYGIPLSPTNISAKQNSPKGSKNTQAIRASNGILFVQAAGRKLREMAFEYTADKYLTPDMTVLSEHITRGGISELAFQQKPHSLVWSKRSDGALIGFTYERDQKVLAWHRHFLGGTSDVSGSPTKVESICVIPNADGTADELWAVVKRYINGSTKRYFEYMTDFWEFGDDQEDSFFVDGGIQYSGSPTLTVSGAFHLSGQTVSILADGAVRPPVMVSSTGKITLDRVASKISLGYGYNSDGETLRFETGSQNGTAQGKTQRIHRAVFRVLDTLGLKVGPDTSHLSQIVFRDGGTPFGMAVPLYTGDKSIEWDGDYNTDNTVCWRFDQPLPGTLLAIMPQMDTYDP